MIQYLVKQFVKNYPLRYKRSTPCGREVCFCLKHLNLKDEQNKIFYESCFSSWFHYKDKNNHQHSLINFAHCDGEGITYNDLVKNVSVIKEIPKQTYYKLFVGSYQKSETYKPKKSRKKTLKKYKEQAF